MTFADELVAPFVPDTARYVGPFFKLWAGVHIFASKKKTPVHIWVGPLAVICNSKPAPLMNIKN